MMSRYATISNFAHSFPSITSHPISTPTLPSFLLLSIFTFYVTLNDCLHSETVSICFGILYLLQWHTGWSFMFIHAMIFMISREICCYDFHDQIKCVISRYKHKEIIFCIFDYMIHFLKLFDIFRHLFTIINCKHTPGAYEISTKVKLDSRLRPTFALMWNQPFN